MGLYPLLTLAWVPGSSYSFHRQQTVGALEYVGYYPVTTGTDLTAPAWAKLRSIKNERAAEQASRYLAILTDRLTGLKEDGNLPPVQLFEADDGSLLIEWTFSDLRLGFTIEQTENESGWYLVANVRAGKIHTSGYLRDVDVESFMTWLITVVLTLES